MAQVTQFRFAATRLLTEPGIRIGLRCVCFIGPLLTMEAAAGITVAAVLALETLLAGPGLDQRTVYREVFLLEMLLGLLQHLTEELPRHHSFSNRSRFLLTTGWFHTAPRPFPGRRTTGTAGCNPDAPSASVHCESSRTSAATTLVADARAGSMADRCPRTIVEVLRHRRQNLVHQLPDRPQRLICRYPLLHRHVAEHPALLILVSAHYNKTFPICSWLPATHLFQYVPKPHKCLSQPHAEGPLLATRQLNDRDGVRRKSVRNCRSGNRKRFGADVHVLRTTKWVRCNFVFAIELENPGDSSCAWCPSSDPDTRLHVVVFIAVDDGHV